MLVVITQMDYINPSKLFCLEVGCFKSYFNMVKMNINGCFDYFLQCCVAKLNKVWKQELSECFDTVI